MMGEAKRRKAEGGTISGFRPEWHIGLPIEEIPLSEIEEPWRYRSLKRITQFVKMLETGKVAPPIELIQIKQESLPYEVRRYESYNGAHRYKAALLAGRETILAVVVAVEDEEAVVFKGDGGENLQ